MRKERDLSDITSALWRRLTQYYYQGNKETPCIDYYVETHRGMRYFNFHFNGEPTGIGRTLVYFEGGKPILFERELQDILLKISNHMGEGNWTNIKVPASLSFCHCRGYYSNICTSEMPCPQCHGIPPEETGYVYFIRDNKRVKIGYSKNPARRLSQFRTVLPHIVEMYVETGNMLLEKYYHEWFSDYSTGGEWFHWNYELQTFLTNKGELARNLYNEPMKPI